MARWTKDLPEVAPGCQDFVRSDLTGRVDCPISALVRTNDESGARLSSQPRYDGPAAVSC